MNNSNLMKELPRCQLISVNMTVTILNITCGASDHESDDTTDYCTQQMIQTKNSKKSKQRVIAFILSVLKVF